MGVEVRQLGPKDVDEYVALRRESLQDSPLAFAASPETDRGASPDFIREDLTNPRSAIFGAFDPDLFGVAGIVASKGKSSHTAHIWGMYVKPVHRGAGAGRALLEALTHFAAELEAVDQIQLSVAESASAAHGLYLSAGFETWGTEPDGLRHGFASVAVLHMVKKVPGRAL